MVHLLMAHLLASAAATGTTGAASSSSPLVSGSGGANAFFSTSLGKDLKDALTLISFPLALFVTFLVIKKFWRKSHKEAAAMLVVVAIAVYLANNPAQIGTVWSTLSGWGGAAFKWISSL